MGNVIKDCSLEENRFLLDETDVLAEPADVEGVDGTAIEFDSSRGRIVPTFDEADDGGFSGPGLALDVSISAFLDPMRRINGGNLQPEQ